MPIYLHIFICNSLFVLIAAFVIRFRAVYILVEFHNSADKGQTIVVLRFPAENDLYRSMETREIFKIFDYFNVIEICEYTIAITTITLKHFGIGNDL